LFSAWGAQNEDIIDRKRPLVFPSPKTTLAHTSNLYSTIQKLHIFDVQKSLLCFCSHKSPHETTSCALCKEAHLLVLPRYLLKRTNSLLGHAFSKLQ
jgi:hypothetical protein